MNNKTRFTTVALTTLLFQASHAEDIEIGAREIANLGIEFALPELAREVAVIEATATVVIPPMAEVIIGTPQAGLLAGLDTAVGEEVRQGQVMARLQSPEFLTLQREFLDTLNTSLLAQNELDRDRQLFDEGIISGRRYQETTTRSRIAATGLNEHRHLLQIAGLSDDELSALETQQKFVQVLEIRAPFDGVVLERMATAGQRLDAMSPVYRLADLSTLWLEIDVPQEQLAAVRPGMMVAVEGSAIILPAQITTIGRSIDPATQTVMVRAILGQEGHGLKPGQFVSAQIVASGDASIEPVWIVPAASVTRMDERHFVFVRMPDSIRVSEVLLVSSDRRHAYLTGDVNADMQIVVSGVASLKALWSAQREPAT